MRTPDLMPWPDGRPPEPGFCGEDARASILATYGFDALQDDPELSEIAKFAAELCDTPVVLVSIVEKERQRFLAREGVTETETPRPTSFCAHAMLQAELMEVPDAMLDPRFENNPLVTGHPHIRFYAGAPLISGEGAPIGSLCVIDVEPRPAGLTPLQRRGLKVLAASVMRRMRHRREALAAENKREETAQDLREMVDLIPQITFTMQPDGTFGFYNKGWFDFTRAEPPASSEDWRPFIHPDDHEPTFSDWYAAVDQGLPFEGEYRLQNGDGEWRWMLSRVKPFGSDKGGQRWFGTLTDIDETYRESETNEILTRELSHRIKNIFAVVSSLIALSSRGKPEVADFSKELNGKITALGRAHDFVRPIDSKKGEFLAGLLKELMAPYGTGNQARAKVTGADIPLAVRAATPLALVFHELATNSAKYGALSAPAGSVAIDISESGENVVVAWRETGGPQIVETDHRGFGSRLMEMSVKGQLQGSLERRWHPEGLEVELTVMRSALTS
ncbi:sensor histidine kinase [Altererythrobacter aquiaggeris]|uniref:sensor histidine kinase n=1 Tax=Aestuarierythrobacter aquiaggeris TaxID=1898396 RepID=UPI0030158A9D